ncbi:MAG: hypothetical protein JXQ87_09255 [Bacteroidia bacterium]
MSNEKKKETQNQKLLKGFLSTFFVPFIGPIIIYFLKFNGKSLSYFFKAFHSYDLVIPIFSISLIPGILLYFNKINKGQYKYAQGIMLNVMFWLLLAVYIKFLL